MTAQEVSRAIRRWRSACRALAVFSVLSILVPAAAAAQIVVEPKVGFHGVFQLGRPFPLEVNLENTGPPADGILEIQVWKGGAAQGGVSYRVFHRREVFLPARSRRTVHFTVDPDVLSRPLQIRFTSTTATASRELDLRRHFSTAPLVLSVSEGSAVPLTSLGASLTNRVVALSLAELPPEARALLGVSHLVIYDQSLRDLSRVQLRALDDWLAAGGRMVIIGSLNFTLYQEPQLARYLPVRVSGVKRTAFTAHGDVGEDKAIPDVWAQTATVVRGKVLAESEGLPVLVENNWGKGKVTYLALDAGRPPLSTWKGLPKLLQSLLTPAVGENPSPRPQWSESIFSQVLLSPSFISSYIPNRSLFFAILGYLAGLVVLWRLWQRRRIARHTLVLSCCGWILCAAAAGYLFFSRGGRTPDGVLLAATVMENAGDGYVEARSNLALFSTQLREYSLVFGRGWVDSMPLAAPASAQPGQFLVYRHTGGVTRVQLPLKAWGFRLLRGRYVEQLRLDAAIEREGERLLLKVENQSSKDLTDCWLLAPGTRIALGNLPAGERWTKAFALSAAGGASGGPPRAWGVEEENLRKITFSDKPRDVLFHASFFPPDGAQTAARGGAALFFCWVKDPEPAFEIGDPRIRVQHYALYRVIVPLAGPEEE
jgi:hypothetical protein